MEEFIKNFGDILEETEISELNAETKFKELGEWDSMTALMLIAMVDENYDIKITGNHIKEAVTMSDLYKIVQK